MRLIDADALINFIDMGHLRNPLESCYSEQDVVDMLESRPTIEQPQWISCADRLPNDEEKVLAFTAREKAKDIISVDTFVKGFGFFSPVDYPGKEYVTHWMPLPQPPKGDE